MDKFKKYLPYLIAFLIFIILPSIYFAPQFEGKDIRKFDSVQANGMTSPVIEHIKIYEEHPFWVANMFGGMPSYPIHFDAPFDIFKSLSWKVHFLGDPASYYFLLMLGFYIMLLFFGVNPWLSIVGAVAYGFSTYFIIIFQAGHIMKIIALIYIAPLIGALYYTYRKSIYIGAPLFGIFTLVEISSVHPQITYYFILAMLFMVMSIGVYQYRKKELKSFFISSAVLLGVTILAVGANITYLYYTYDYSKDSIRGDVILNSDNPSEVTSSGLDKDYITAWSYGKMETLNLFIPNLYGGKSDGGTFSEDGEVAKSLQKFVSKREAAKISKSLPGYWGPQPMTSGPVYIGAVMISLFVLGLFLIRGVNLWWIVGATSLSLLLAWGKHFMPLTDLFIDYFPLYNKFRTVSMILVVVELTVPLMAMLVLNKIIKAKIETTIVEKALLKTLYITGGIALLFILFGGMMFQFSSATDFGQGLNQDIISAMQSERASLMRADSFRSLIFVILTLGAVWFFVKKRISSKILISLLLVLVIADMVPIAVRHVNYSMFNEEKTKSALVPRTAIDNEILKDKDINYRVANFTVSTFNDATTSVNHRSIGGYFAAKPRRYQDIIDHHLQGMNMNVYNMLNTKYFIVPQKDAAPILNVNREAYGNAWIISNIKYVDSPNSEIAALGEEDLSNTAIINQEFDQMINNAQFEPNINDKIEHTEYRANYMKYSSSLEEDRVVVFSEMYYPKGWTAYIDGEEAPYFRANYILNAMVVPKGEHEIEFKFVPPYISTMRVVSVASSSILMLLFALGLFVTIRKRKILEK